MRYQQIIKNIAQSISPLLSWANPQTQPLPGQIANNAGGYYFPVDDYVCLNRFLILGSESGTYYVSAPKLTLDNTKAIQRLIENDGVKVVERIVEISMSGRAPKNEPALFALALATAANDAKTRSVAFEAITKVARTGTHILIFVDFVNNLRGWGRGFRKAISRWFLVTPLEQLTLQAVKYSQRSGWSMRDLLRLSHPVTNDIERLALIDWIAHPKKPDAIISAREKFRLIEGKYRVNEALDSASVAKAIRQYSLPREAVPNKHLEHTEVWNALLVDMPMKAMIRNLAKMTEVGLLTSLSDVSDYIVNRLLDSEQIKNARIHPIDLLLALRTYAQGHGQLGKLTWEPVPAIIEALNAAFYCAFQQHEPTNKRILIGLDVSGSMQESKCSGSPVLQCVEAAGATAMLFVNAESNIHTMAFDTCARELPITKSQRLDDVLKAIKRLSGGGTDISEPIAYALKRKIKVDAFVILTDNETWAGDAHPVQMLRKYRQSINQSAKLVVLATASNKGDICDPNDTLSLGIAGFDTAALQLVSQFIND